jgi:protein-S-isoprenylcysteine O-methyltransferase Ste14
MPRLNVGPGELGVRPLLAEVIAMSTSESPNQEQSKRVRLPHWITPPLLTGLFLLGHVAAPWGLSLLSTRHGWVDGRPGPWNLLALSLVAAGIAGTLWLVALHFHASPDSFLELRPVQKLLTPGPYAVSRNPTYLFELAIWFGWTLFYGSLAVLIGFLLWVALFNFVLVPYEERDLEARFGEPYRAYKARVPRWLGLPRR